MSQSARRSSQETDHSSFDPTGAVFSCASGDLTVQK
jgi:hypothetical protein